MSDETENLSERDEIEMLLPWYATGRLNADERRRVAAYLAAHPEMRRQIELIDDEHHATIVANEALGAPRPGGLDRLRQSIAAEKTPLDHARSGVGGLLREFGRLFSNPTPAAVRFAGAAAAVVLIAQALAIGMLVTGPAPDGPRYETASGPEAGATQGTFVLIQFAPTASAEQIATVLAAAGAEITGGPKPGGLFEVRLSKSKLGEQETAERIGQLRANEGLITLVVPRS
jgi:anti-sigma factor RsiW